MIAMTVELWKLPVPATALAKGPTFAMLMKRQCEISFHIEGDDGDTPKISLLFDGVEAYKCTCLTSCTAEMFNTAYGKVVRLESSSWLKDVLKVSEGRSTSPRDLQHLMICFDDGPCYEFICRDFKVVGG